MSDLNLSTEQLHQYKDEMIRILEGQNDICEHIEAFKAKEQDLGKNARNVWNKRTEHKAAINNEIKKLKNFDVVLAVVGTMKAGKSTTINAIIGREILPNRNRPMTALPTLICHNPEQATPKLHIKTQTINEFIASIQDKVASLNTSEISDKTMLDLITFIKSGGRFQDSYTGEKNIFDFLCLLNDLVRLAKQLQEQDKNIQFPFDAYKDFDNLPMIEVAFNLKSDFDTQGRFMLLDTAAPNETGQEELLAGHLAFCSAAIIVLDCTQLNTQAEADVKREIDKISAIQPSRLFALVNKFDQQNANSGDADSVKKHIFNDLLKDKINFEHIYPISAQDAYLGYRMASYIQEHGNKPAYLDGTWVADFAKKSFGKHRRTQRNYEESDATQINECIEDIIADSLIEQPINEIIANIQKNAPVIESSVINTNCLIGQTNKIINAIHGNKKQPTKPTTQEQKTLARITGCNRDLLEDLQEVAKVLHISIPNISLKYEALDDVKTEQIPVKSKDDKPQEQKPATSTEEAVAMKRYMDAIKRLEEKERRNRTEREMKYQDDIKKLQADIDQGKNEDRCYREIARIKMEKQRMDGKKARQAERDRERLKKKYLTSSEDPKPAREQMGKTHSNWFNFMHDKKY
ncbi:dynamin family protein [Moraxella marmotae]|uniref:dynamin family protein n=1 Tax=Moraxella marmotae TaxID=3344520 RepID=UPI0035F2EEEE